MGIQWSLMGLRNADWMEFTGDLTVFNGDLMVFHWILMGMYSGINGI